MIGIMGWMMWSVMRGGGHGAADDGDPVETLKQRYARRELTTQEFHERLRILEGQPGRSTDLSG